MLPWAYCVIIDLSHYANVEKQLACVFVCVFVGLFFFFSFLLYMCVCVHANARAACLLIINY